MGQAAFTESNGQGSLAVGAQVRPCASAYSALQLGSPQLPW